MKKNTVLQSRLQYDKAADETGVASVMQTKEYMQTHGTFTINSDRYSTWMYVTYRCNTTRPINPFINLIFCQHDVLFMENLVILSWVTHLITLIALLLKTTFMLEWIIKNPQRSNFPEEGFDYTLTCNAYFPYLKIFIVKFLSAWLVNDVVSRSAFVVFKGGRWEWSTKHSLLTLKNVLRVYYLSTIRQYLKTHLE